MGTLTKDIKYKSDPLYLKYESQIDKYYASKHEYNNLSLTDYIFRFYIQLDYCSAFDHDSKTISAIRKYIENLYYHYCDHYLHVDNYRITEKDIENLMLQNKIVKHQTVKYIFQKQHSYNANIKTLITKCFDDMRKLPMYALWDVSQQDIHIFLAQLIDFYICERIKNDSTLY